LPISRATASGKVKKFELRDAMRKRGTRLSAREGRSDGELPTASRSRT